MGQRTGRRRRAGIIRGRRKGGVWRGKVGGRLDSMGIRDRKGLTQRIANPQKAFCPIVEMSSLDTKNVYDNKRMTQDI